MSADLDELFTALNQRADGIPLIGADHARQLGRRRRTRNRAVLAAAAVLLVLTGAGLVVNRDRRAEPILPATTPARIRGLAPVGEPVRIGDGRIWTGARISGNRVIGFSGDNEGRHVTAARDVITGETLWTLTDLAGPDRGRYRGVAVTPDSVIFVLELGEASELTDEPVPKALEFHDPQTGARRWDLPITTEDRFVLHRSVLVRLVGATGELEAYDLVSGERLWSAPPDGDRPRMISGTRTGADADEIGSTGDEVLWDPSSAKAFPVTDDRLVVATTGNRVVTRDIRTGVVRSSEQARPGAEEMTAFDGTAYLLERFADGLGVSTPERVLYQPGPSWHLEQYFGCGPARLCVWESSGDNSARLVQIDSSTGTVLRTTGAVPLVGTTGMRLGHVFVSAGGDKGTALYDDAGEARYSDNGIGGFIDDGNVLTLTRDAGDGRFTARGVSNIDYRKVTLGSVPEISGRCDWNAELLTCPAGSELRIWRFTR